MAKTRRVRIIFFLGKALFLVKTLKFKKMASRQNLLDGMIILF